MARIAAMMSGDGARKRQGAHVDEDEHAQNLFGRVRDGGERIRGKDREAGDAGEAFVMREVRRDRFADDEPLDLAEKPFFGHGRASREAPSGRPKYKKPQRAAAFNQ